MNVICYKRVSANAQADKGFSLTYQEQMLRQYCEMQGYNIIGMYQEDFSAKTFDRHEWKKIMTYVKQNRNNIDMILCLRWDRFSRNMYEALVAIKHLQKYDIVVNAVEQPLDLTNPDHKILLTIYLALSELGRNNFLEGDLFG